MIETWPHCGHLKTLRNTAPNGNRVRCRECRRKTEKKLGPERESVAARLQRRMGETALLEKLLTEAAMPEWYPHQ